MTIYKEFERKKQRREYQKPVSAVVAYNVGTMMNDVSGIDGAGFGGDGDSSMADSKGHGGILFDDETWTGWDDNGTGIQIWE